MTNKNDAFDALSRMSGLRHDQIDDIWLEVKENQKLLNECDRPHLFRPIDKDKYLTREYQCSKCNGRISSREARWYNDGLRDAYSVMIQEPLKRAALCCNSCARMLIEGEHMICQDCERKIANGR
ncbi:MAG: hypothetical protein GF411_02875 [Candidatus Lokiarchaeota archaeon]|nr:hypothetical protein [Candidatus Lokiarchaeota archaeon]